MQTNYINRELSWLAFDKRVLAEASRLENPLYERLRFLSISAGNLDEFFMVRVGCLADRADADFDKPDPSGLTAVEQLARISKEAHGLVEEQYALYHQTLLPDLAKEHIRIVSPAALPKEALRKLRAYFDKNIYPVLTPMAVDSSRPFPFILNLSLNIGVLLKQEQEEPFFATVQVPGVLPRLIPLEEQRQTFVLLEDVITLFMDRLFTAHRILCAHPYRITRSADLEIHEEEADDLLEEMKRTLRRRKRGMAVRLEIAKDAKEELVAYLARALELSGYEIYRIDGPLNLTFLNLLQKDAPPHLLFAPYRPRLPRGIDEDKPVFECIKKGDILLHHPYDSFAPVVRFIREAACDPGVLAIKQTLYRVSGNSPIIKALEVAAENGKQVTVLVEVKARFDEENNINWAIRLEKAGCHVLYGLVGLKTHCKITLVVRREADGIRRYMHFGTGNYNDVTARTYTDFGLLTCSDRFAADAGVLFNRLSGYAVLPKLNRLITAPETLRTTLLDCIRQEAKYGKDGSIFVKCNALVDPEIIRALYEASGAGVKIHLVVRGICCLRPQVKGLSETITVTSIVGRYLEHSRIYYFKHREGQNLFLSSADLMPRNLDRRVELFFPIEDHVTKRRLLQMISLYKKDTAGSWELLSGGSYQRKKPEKKLLPKSCQQYFMEHSI